MITITTKLSDSQLGILFLFSALSSITLGFSKYGSLNENDFFEQDLALSYHFSKDTIETQTLWLINFFVIVGALIITAFTNDNNVLKFDKLILFSFFAYNSIVITDALTEYLKRAIGEPRPCAFYLCNYKGYANAVNSGNYTEYYKQTTFGNIGNFSNCEDIDAFMSWPSGHASTSFSAMLISAIIIEQNIKDHVIYPINLISYVLLAISTYIACSRVQDNKHHSYDIFSGAVIGIVVTITMSFITTNIINDLIKNTQSTSKNNNQSKIDNYDNYFHF